MATKRSELGITYAEDSNKETSQPEQRNAAPDSYHPRAPLAAHDLKDFLDKQYVEGDQAELARLFPTDDQHGWHGYVEWEKFPERKACAKAVLDTKAFTAIPEFQAGPLPATNPILLGHRWKEYHIAIGPSLAKVPDESWTIVKEEKCPNMLHVLDFPYNGEPPRAHLMKDHITSNKDHFVRNHGGIPTIDSSNYTLEVGGLVARPGTLTLDQIKDPNLFPQVEMTVTLQCCGTRRVEQIALYPGEGDELLSAPWAEGAIGSAVYKGVQVKKILKYFGGILENGKHIEGIGADTYFKKNHVFNYAVSVPYRKVKANEAILAYEMNGEPLPRCHGAPLRLVIPGYIGARSTKWITRLNVLDCPSWGPVQRQEYLYFNGQVGKHNVKYSRGFSIQDMPVSSALLFPGERAAVIHQGHIPCSGWAYSGGGRWVERVEVSADGGFTWYEVPEENLSPKHYFAMRLWHFELPCNAEGWIEIVVRCWDNALNTQPTYVRTAWNWTLHVTSSCHRVKVYSANRSKPETARRLAALEANGETFAPITRPAGIDIEPMAEYEAAMAAKGDREPLV